MLFTMFLQDMDGWEGETVEVIHQSKALMSLLHTVAVVLFLFTFIFMNF